MEKKQPTKQAKNKKFVKWVSGLSSYTKNKTINALAFFLSFFVIGGANYAIMFGMFVPTFFILDLFIIVLLASPIFFFKTTMFDRIYLPIILFFITLFYAINACYHQYFGTVFSLKDLYVSLQNINQVGMHIDTVPWWVIILDVCLYLALATGIVLFNALWKFNTGKKEIKLSRKRKVAFALVMLFSSAISFEFCLQMWNISQRNREIRSIDYVNFAPNYHFNNLGMLGYYTQEVRQLLFDKGESVEEIKKFLTDSEYLEDDYTDFFHKLGYEKNPNLLIIMLETGDQCVFNEQTMPNLNRMFNEGINFDRNYSYNHTNVSDLIGFNGNHPIFTPTSSQKFNLPFNLPNILKGKYQSYFMTDLASQNDCYGTMNSIKTYDFDHYLFHDEMIPNVEPWMYEKADYTRDSIFMNAINNKIINMDTTTPFYMHYLTIHMHMDQVLNKYNEQMFSDLEKDFGEKLNQLERDDKWHNPFDAKKQKEDHDRFRRMILKTMDFDAGLGQIMETLYGSGASEDLKNTILVVYGDHSWYEACQDTHTFSQNIKKIYDTSNIHQYSTILGLYHPTLGLRFGLEHPDHKFNKPTWPSIIVPTLLDLLGEKYNPKIYLSKSIFDSEYDENEVFYSFWLNKYMNENFCSNDGITISKTYNSSFSKKQFQERIKFIAWQERIIDSIYKNNIFNKYNYNDFMPKEDIV